MTRRKRTPSPDRSRKRVAFHIPASLAQLSALSRSLASSAPQNAALQQKGNSDIVARAQALSQSPTAEPGWQPLDKQQQQQQQQQAKQIRFKHDSRQFPTQQEWPQPTPNQGAVGHAKFLEKQWQATQAAQVVENARRAQLVQRQMEGKRRALSVNNPLHTSAAQAASSSGIHPDSDPTLNSVSGDSPSKQHPDFSYVSQWPSTPASTSQRQYDIDIEQRRQSIIAKLMERQPTSVATSANPNIQVPTNTTPQPTSQRPEPPAKLDTPLDLTTQPNQIAALIEKKRAENAANGSLTRFLAARSGQQRSQQSKNTTISPAPFNPTANHTSDNIFAFKPHPSNLSNQTPVPSSAKNAGKGARLPTHEDDIIQESDLRSLFSSPALSPQHVPSQRPQLSQRDESEDATVKDGPTQLPSPSLSSPSQQEPYRAPSPSAQLLMNLANAAHAPTSTSSQQSAFRTPPLTVSTQGLTRTSSAPRQRLSTSSNLVPVESSLTAQQREMRLMQRQTEQQRQQNNLQQLHPQQMQPRIQNRYPQAQPQQDTRRQQSSASVMSNPSNYYTIRPQAWDSFGTNKLAMSPPTYVQTSTSNVLGSAPGNSGADYSMSTLDALDTTNMYSGSRGAGYSSFASGPGGETNDNFRMGTQHSYGLSKR